MELKMNEQNLRKSNIVLGLIIIIFGVIFLSIVNISIKGTLIVLAITLFTIAFARIINSISDKTLVLPLGVFKFITGFISVLLVIIIIFNVLSNALLDIDNTLIVYGSLFILIGIERIISGFILKDLTKGFKIVLIVVGVLIAILSIVILIFSFLDYLIAIYLISIVLILSGLVRILHGIYLNK